MRLLEFGGDAQELLDVLGSGLGLHGALGAERLHQAALVHDHLDDVLELAVHTTSLAHDVRKVAEGMAHLGGEHARLGDGELTRLEERAGIHAGQVLDLADGG